MAGFILSIEYAGRKQIYIETEQNDEILSIDLLLKFDSTDSTEDIIASLDEPEAVRSPQTFFDRFRAFMSTCTCDKVYQCNDDCEPSCSSIKQKFMNITGITLTDHHDWRGCFAFRVFYYCIHEYSYRIEKLFPDENAAQFYNCGELLSELIMLTSLGYPSALNIIAEKVSLDMSIDTLMILARAIDRVGE